MQQVIACSEDSFAFGEPDEIFLRNYHYLVPEDCLLLSHVRHGITDPKYGYRYKLLLGGIIACFPDAVEERVRNGDFDGDFYVTLVVIFDELLFADVRRWNYIFITPSRDLEPTIGSLHIQFYFPRTETAVGRAYDVPASLAQPEFMLAKSWLNDCILGLEKHEVCRHIEGLPTLPTRVVDVGSSESDVCRLHISHAGEKRTYVALSDCWGGTVPITTTTSNVQEFVKILPGEMPKTFADAIAVTRRMGERYLWIDSLHILQDSVEDWVVEFSHMDQVYSQALFTISTDAAEDSSSGFLEPPARNIHTISMVTRDIPSPAGMGASPVTVHVRERGDLGFQLHYHYSKPGHHHYLLNPRGPARSTPSLDLRYR